eukprot:3938515-Rhodomonas_salina.1
MHESPKGNSKRTRRVHGGFWRSKAGRRNGSSASWRKGRRHGARVRCLGCEDEREDGKRACWGWGGEGRSVLWRARRREGKVL